MHLSGNTFESQNQHKLLELLIWFPCESGCLTVSMKRSKNLLGEFVYLCLAKNSFKIS